MISITPLPYHHDSSVIFSAIRDWPFSCWLDSGKPKSTSGRYDIMCAQPSQRWVTMDGTSRRYGYQYEHEHKHEHEHSYSPNNSAPSSTPAVTETLLDCSQEDPIALVKAMASTIAAKYHAADHSHSDITLPFMSGVVAYFAYDLHRNSDWAKTENQATLTHCQLPQMVAGQYPWAIVQDHELRRCYFVVLNDRDNGDDRNDGDANTHIITQIKNAISANTAQPLQSSPPSAAFSVNPLQAITPEARYHQKMARIHDYIAAGDCYQVNLSQCFSAEYTGDPYTAYLQLRKKMASPFSAFMDIGDSSIMSLSPERLLKTQGRQVLTQPIKGTIARGDTQEADKKNADTLLASEKNRAENVMIVDLLRNDLGKNCVAGSIKVPTLFGLESYPNVHHLVSDITGEIAVDKEPLDVFQGSFPGGSITGAPKKRAMEIIEELEDVPRSIYCGSIAYISAHGDMDSNITIRTIACDKQRLYCWGGGGIVADSEADEEYQESLTKIGALLEVLDSFNPTI